MELSRVLESYIIFDDEYYDLEYVDEGLKSFIGGIGKRILGIFKRIVGFLRRIKDILKKLLQRKSNGNVSKASPDDIVKNVSGNKEQIKVVDLNDFREWVLSVKSTITILNYTFDRKKNNKSRDSDNDNLKRAHEKMLELSEKFSPPYMLEYDSIVFENLYSMINEAHNKSLSIIDKINQKPLDISYKYLLKVSEDVSENIADVLHLLRDMEVILR